MSWIPGVRWACSRLCLRTGVAGAALVSPWGAKAFGAGAEGGAGGRVCTCVMAACHRRRRWGTPMAASSSSTSIWVSGTESGFPAGVCRDNPPGAHLGPGAALAAFLACFAGALVDFRAEASRLGASGPLAPSLGFSAISIALRRLARSQTTLDSAVKCALISVAALGWAGDGASVCAVRVPGVFTVVCAVLPGALAVTVVVVVAAARVVPQIRLYPLFFRIKASLFHHSGHLLDASMLCRTSVPFDRQARRASLLILLVLGRTLSSRVPLHLTHHRPAWMRRSPLRTFLPWLPLPSGNFR